MMTTRTPPKPPTPQQQEVAAMTEAAPIRIPSDHDDGSVSRPAVETVCGLVAAICLAIDLHSCEICVATFNLAFSVQFWHFYLLLLVGHFKKFKVVVSKFSSSVNAVQATHSFRTPRHCPFKLISYLKAECPSPLLRASPIMYNINLLKT
jgi:hypothetical protein